MKTIYLYCGAILALTLQSCDGVGQSKGAFSLSEEFKSYWYAGDAELSSYELIQARYGEERAGSAVLIFVTEPFSRSRQVKLDDPGAAGKDHLSVMKLNFTKKFLTGIYPYSMMYSTFTPVDTVRDPYTLKLTNSSQEWCGHTFMQLNRKGSGYAVSAHSYFESEGDVSEQVNADLLEDELWSRIRLSPDHLPIGAISLFPSGFYLRLRHQPVRAVEARASLQKLDSSVYAAGVHRRYSLVYNDRTLVIYFEDAFPHRILGWEETYRSGFGAEAKEMTTTAKLKKSIKLDYWRRNGNEDLHFREELGLPQE